MLALLVHLRRTAPRMVVGVAPPPPWAPVGFQVPAHAAPLLRRKGGRASPFQLGIGLSRGRAA
ncbi:hypothetical protein ACWC9T_42055, partial [Kitasatospora sp. NPDC001159]